MTVNVPLPAPPTCSWPTGIVQIEAGPSTVTVAVPFWAIPQTRRLHPEETVPPSVIVREAVPDAPIRVKLNSPPAWFQAEPTPVTTTDPTEPGPTPTSPVDELTVAPAVIVRVPKPPEPTAMKADAVNDEPAPVTVTFPVDPGSGAISTLTFRS